MATQPDRDQSERESSAEVVEPELPPPSEGDLPPLDFGTLVVSLRTSAMLHMGHGERDDAGLHLALARQEIDLLGLLEDKTRGNLTGEEERLLSQVLTDLREAYERKSQ